MRVHPVRVDRLAGVERISCEVSGGGSTDIWCFDVPVDLPWLRTAEVGVDAFLPLAGLLAGALGEDLEVDDPVDPALLLGLAEVADLTRSWWGWRQPVVRAEVRAPASVRPSRRAAMFSRGVDSSAEVASALLGEAPRIDALVSIWGNDALWSPEVERTQLASTRAVAEELGLPLVELRSNLRSVADRYTGWDRTHGAVLAGAAHVLGSGCGEVVVAQPVAAATEAARGRPHGLTRRLAAAWSTAGVQLTESAADRTRFDKVAQVLRVPALARSLQVCWESGRVGNCGRCLKCLTTEMALVAQDRRDLVESLFEAPWDPERVRRLERPDPTVPGVALEVVAACRDVASAGGPADLVEAIDAWDEVTARSGNGADAGLAGFDLAGALRSAGPRPDGPAVEPPELAGWGVGATPVHVPAAERSALLNRAVPEGRPIDWCLVDRRSPRSVELAAHLAEVRPGGAVLLVEESCPTAPPSAVRRLLRASHVRCWPSDASHLEAVPLLEALAAGCVPVQVSTDPVAVRLWLPEWAHVLVRGVEEVDDFLADEELRAAAFRAAVALATGGSLERDAARLAEGVA